MANYQIEDVEGIGPIRGEQFRKAGIKDTDKLLAACKTPKKREELSVSACKCIKKETVKIVVKFN